MGPEYYAQRIRACYLVSESARMEELLAICSDRGVEVRWGRLRGRGYYARLPEPVIALDWNATPFVLAHELYHHLAAELAEWDDDDQLAIYVFTPGGRSQQERDANRFAELLCPEEAGR